MSMQTSSRLVKWLTAMRSECCCCNGSRPKDWSTCDEVVTWQADCPERQNSFFKSLILWISADGKVIWIFWGAREETDPFQVIFGWSFEKSRSRICVKCPRYPVWYWWLNWTALTKPAIKNRGMVPARKLCCWFPPCSSFFIWRFGQSLIKRAPMPLGP